MKYINSHQSRNCNPHFFSSVWELWPLGHSHIHTGSIWALSSLKSVVVAYEMQNLHGRDWASPYPVVNCAVVRPHAWKLGNVIFDISKLPECSSARDIKVAVRGSSGSQLPGKAMLTKVEAAAEFGHFPDEMENDRAVCRSWVGTSTSKVGARWNLGL